MRSAKIMTLVTVLVLLAGTMRIAGAQDRAAEAKAAAQKAAEAWLGRVDRGEYATSWEESAALFRNAVTRDAWVASARAARGPLGKLRQRRLQSAQYATSLPGAPDGQYVVLQFATAFENKASAVETVTPMLDRDGKWRVSGYYIK